ncbi:MAG TPA: O-antigen ligase family protein [Flavobacteriales bacterium]
MTLFLREHVALFGVILFWVVTTVVLGPAIYLILPVSVFFLWRRDLWPEMLFGFLMVLILSDMSPDIMAMRGFKTAKNTYIVALACLLMLERQRLAPLANVFTIFLPLFIYSLFPLIFSGAVLVGLQKTLSYALIFLVVPNYVLHNFRRQGWDFFRNLMLFIVVVLASQRLYMQLGPSWWSHLGGRFRGYFGNPNGLAMFSYLSFMMFTVLLHVKKDLFSFKGKLVIYAVIIYFLLQSGSRASLMSTMIFLVFSRFFRFSPFIGFVAFIAFIAVTEVVSNNLPAIVTMLGLESYFRLQTLTDGSGRYFAWEFAWRKINEGGFFLFGGGIGNDEYIMRQHYPYLRSMGHHGGVHNSYLTLWFDLGIVGLIIYFRGFFLIFLKASKRAPIALAVMFSVMFSITYESWLAGSLNPFTILLLIMLTVLTEDEILHWNESEPGEEDAHALEGPPVVEELPVFRPPAR